MKSEVVIVGAGHAGGMASIFLRKMNFNGPITLIGQEEYIPYQRPPLSKEFLLDKMAEKSMFLKSEDFYKKNDIRIIKNTSVIKIEREEKSVVLSDGKGVPYDKLILATGGNVNRINFTSNNNEIFYMRGLNDAKSLKGIMINHNKALIIGSGFIGLEVAAVLKMKGLDVTISEFEDRVLTRSLSKLTANFMQNRHEKEGVKFIFKKKVRDILEIDGQKKAALNDGSYIDYDFIVVGIGIKPNEELASDASLAIENGIIVDENCMTSDPSIFAIGDCTNHLNNIIGKRIRLESVQNAVEQAKIVAHFITKTAQPDDRVPWFWSNQYNIKLRIAGIPAKNDLEVVRGDISKESFTVFHIRDEKVILVESINNMKEFLIGKKLIEKQLNISKYNLSDLKFNLDTIFEKD